MKKFILILSAFLCLNAVQAQVENPATATKNAATDATNSNIDNGANSAVNKVENGIKGLFHRKKKKGSSEENNPSSQSGNSNSNSNSNSNTTASSGGSSVPTIKTYTNYDFVPGDTVIFQSQLADEEVGEIPSQFTLSNGQADVQVEDGENVIHVPKGDGAVITPRMTSQAYMPDQFTVEFDVKNEAWGLNHFSVDFGQRVYYSGGEGITPGIEFGDGSVTWTLGDVAFPDALHTNGDYPMIWHHVAIAVNKNVGKVYVDQFRVANVNNLTGKPNNVTLSINGYENSYFKNIRIAKGGIDIYRESTTPAKIVMHGILFDVNKATLKPESMGSINMIYHVMTKDPSVHYEIDGHTDNTGDAAHNLTLSQQRADAVKAQLVTMGIDGSRLTTKGFGDTKPIASNDTPEGRANNRRVEFIKQ
ncbi:MAG: OmpA family protein [Bacteroidota bacterium]|nr:OmpA family protein [Bacteroidota bacterium]